MKKYDILIFDLDGTLTDPASGLVSGFEYALYKMGLPAESKEALKRFIGPPLLDVWQSEYSLSYAGAREMIRLFREYYDIYGWWDNRPYPDIERALCTLRTSGKRLFVATSKPEYIAKKVLSLFGLSKYFEFIGGAQTEGERYTKEAVLEYVITENKIDRDKALMIGDRVYDAQGAAVCGIDALAVSYGHGSLAELEGSPFVKIAKSPLELVSLLI